MNEKLDGKNEGKNKGKKGRRKKNRSESAMSQSHISVVDKNIDDMEKCSVYERKTARKKIKTKTYKNEGENK